MSVSKWEKNIAYSTSGRGHTSDVTHEQMAVAYEEASYVLCVTDFLKVKLSRENFHGYVKKKKRIQYP